MRRILPSRDLAAWKRLWARLLHRRRPQAVSTPRSIACAAKEAGTPSRTRPPAMDRPSGGCEHAST
eukprot:4822944-Pyramimonas_sp.AAC.1